MIGRSRITMARLAERFAPSLGNSQQTTNDPNPVLQPLLNRQVQNTMAGNTYLPFSPNERNNNNYDLSGGWWDTADPNKAPKNQETSGIDATSIQSLLASLLGGGSQGGNQGLTGGMAHSSPRPGDPLVDDSGDGGGGGVGGGGGGARDPRTGGGGGSPRFPPGRVGTGPTYIPPSNEQPIGTGGGGGGGGNTGGPGDNPPPRNPQGRVGTVPFNEVPGGGAGGWVPDLPPQEYTPGAGFLDFRPQQVAGPSSLENWAAGNVTDLWKRPTESLQARDTLANMKNIMNGNVGDILSGQSATNALDPVAQMFDKYIQPTVGNQAALMGLDRGTGETNAIGAAKAQYMLPMMQQLLGLEDSRRSTDLNATLGQAGQYANLGTAQDARQNQTINQAMTVGGTGRGIANQAGAANAAEISRLASAAENMSMGALGMVPSSVGTTSSAKPGLISTVFS